MSRTILLADDSLTIQKVVELTFADTDYEVVSLSSGDDLLQKLDEVSPDLVICDIIMPGRDGYEVCQEIKSDPATLHIPVILLSGTFEPFDRDRALAAGCSEIITKPFEARKLVETVEKLLVGETATRPAAAEAVTIDTAMSTDPDMLTVESIPEYVDDSAPAAAEPPDAAALPDSSLDFTDTGFAEMEQAAVRQRQQRDAAIPDEGLDFEFSDEHEAFGSPELSPPPEMPAEPDPNADEGAAAADEHSPFAEPEATTEDEAFRDIGRMPEFAAVMDEPADTADLEAIEPEQSAASDFETSSEETEFQRPASAETVDEIDTGEPFPTSESADDIGEPAPAGHDPFVSEFTDEPLALEDAPAQPTEEETPTAEAVGAFEMSPETIEIAAPEAAFEASEELFSDEPEPEGDVVVDVEFERDITDEADSLDDIGVESQPPAVPLQEDKAEETTPAAADTGPVPAELTSLRPERTPDEPFRQPEPVPTAPLAEVGRLSDEDVDRIARRVLELAATRFEQLAWEIVPDMAEIAVRQRIRELEGEIEGSSEDESR